MRSSRLLSAADSLNPIPPEANVVRKILVATDFTSLSNQALQRARLIAISTAARLTLAHIVDDDQPERLLISAISAAKSQLRIIATSFQERDGIDADCFVASGESASGILDAADETEAELIVLGPALNPALGTFTGRTVGRVLRASRRPLLVAATPALTSYSRCLLAVDFDEASKSAARAALTLGVFDKMNVTIMHTLDREEEKERRVGSLAQTWRRSASVLLTPAHSPI